MISVLLSFNQISSLRVLILLIFHFMYEVSWKTMPQAGGVWMVGIPGGPPFLEDTPHEMSHTKDL